jgi:predicted TIM-barrel fold metal-dependent hydrolase
VLHAKANQKGSKFTYSCVVENSIAVLADYIGPHKIMWATDYPHQDGFFPGAPKMIHDRLGPLSAEAKHQVMAGGSLGFYGMS